VEAREESSDINEVNEIKEGSIWFKRFYKDCKRISPQLRFVKVKLGFYRIYYKQAYIHEVFKEMPEKGYDLDDLDPRLESQKYFEEFEDNTELTRKIKNYIEGYWDSLDRIQTRVYMMKHDKEFNEKATNAYKTMVVK
jgi:hypothetical protein